MNHQPKFDPRNSAREKRRRALNAPLPGEVRLKVFCTEQAALHGITALGIWNRVQDGKYPGIHIRRANKRVVFVSFPKTPP